MKVPQQQLYPINWPLRQQKTHLPRRVRTTRKAHVSLPRCKQRTTKPAIAFERSSEAGFRSKKHLINQRRKKSTLGTSTASATSSATNSSSALSPFRSRLSSGRNSPRKNLFRDTQATDISEALHRLLLSETQRQQLPHICESRKRFVNYTFSNRISSARGLQRSWVFGRSVADQRTRESAGQIDGPAGTPIDRSDDTALTISSIQQNQFDSTNARNLLDRTGNPSLNHLADLRREAYQDLALSTQTYNDSIVNRMRYLETLSWEDQHAILHGDSSGWMTGEEEFHVEDVPDDVDVDELITLMEKDSVGIKDYGELLEFERRVIGHNVDEANWVGDLW